MNSSEQLTEDRVLLTVAQYAQHFNLSENTVRTKINRNKLPTVRVEKEGREIICIPVSHTRMHQSQAVNTSEIEEIVQETVQGTVLNHSESPDGLLSFMRDTFEEVRNYSHQIVELSRENERYKLLSDGHSQHLKDLEKQVEQLKALVFERDARIRELEEKLIQKEKGWRFW